MVVSAGGGSAAEGPRADPHLDWADLAELVAAAADGDQDAWNELVHRLGGLIWSICRSFRLSEADGADVFQFTWLQLVDKLQTIQDPRRLPGWLATTARRECLAVVRRRTRSLPIGEAVLLDGILPAAPAADGPALVRQRDSVVWQAYFRLGQECQRMLWLLVIDPPDSDVYASAANRLDMPKGSLGPKRGRCLEQLKRHLAEVGITGLGDTSDG